MSLALKMLFTTFVMAVVTWLIGITTESNRVSDITYRVMHGLLVVTIGLFLYLIWTT